MTPHRPALRLHPLRRIRFRVQKPCSCSCYSLVQSRYYAALDNFRRRLSRRAVPPAPTFVGAPNLDFHASKLENPRPRPHLRRPDTDAGDGRASRLRPVPATDDAGARLGARDLRLRTGDAEPAVGHHSASDRPDRRPLWRRQGAGSRFRALRAGADRHGLCHQQYRFCFFRRHPDRHRAIRHHFQRHLRRARSHHAAGKTQHGARHRRRGRLLRTVRPVAGIAVADQWLRLA